MGYTSLTHNRCFGPFKPHLQLWNSARNALPIKRLKRPSALAPQMGRRPGWGFSETLEMLLGEDFDMKGVFMGIPVYHNWLVVWNMFYFPIYWVANHPNWLSYFSEGWPNHQPAWIYCVCIHTLFSQWCPEMGLIIGGVLLNGKVGNHWMEWGSSGIVMGYKLGSSSWRMAMTLY